MAQVEMYALTEWSLAGQSSVIRALKVTFNVLCGVTFNQRSFGRRSVNVQ